MQITALEFEAVVLQPSSANGPQIVVLFEFQSLEFELFEDQGEECAQGNIEQQS